MELASQLGKSRLDPFDDPRDLVIQKVLLIAQLFCGFLAHITGRNRARP
jgi:hypothetical protein